MSHPILSISQTCLTSEMFGMAINQVQPKMFSEIACDKSGIVLPSFRQLVKYLFFLLSFCLIYPGISVFLLIFVFALMSFHLYGIYSSYTYLFLQYSSSFRLVNMFSITDMSAFAQTGVRENELTLSYFLHLLLTINMINTHIGIYKICFVMTFL